MTSKKITDEVYTILFKNRFIGKKKTYLNYISDLYSTSYKKIVSIYCKEGIPKYDLKEMNNQFFIVFGALIATNKDLYNTILSKLDASREPIITDEDFDKLDHDERKLISEHNEFLMLTATIGIGMYALKGNGVTF